jgi:protein SCO1/2
MTRAWRAIVLAMSLLALVVARPASAQHRPSGAPPRPSEQRPTFAERIPAELEGIGIADKSGAELPRDVRLTGSDGRDFILGEYMDGDKPLVLVLAYYGCPMLCSLVLNGTVDVLKAVPKSAGSDFRVLVVSFDPRDKPEVARGKRAAYLEAYGREADLAAFEFAIGSEAEVLRLADAVGFRYRWDDAQQQYAHAAGIFVVTPGGKLSQALTGIKFEADDLTAALGEADKGVWRSPLKSALLFCFQYNPQTGKYVLAAGRAMQVAAGVTIAVIAALLYRLIRGEREQAKS